MRRAVTGGVVVGLVLVLGLASKEPVRVDEPGMIATSFPTFAALMRGLGGDISED